MAFSNNTGRQAHSRTVVQITGEFCTADLSPLERAANAREVVLSWLAEKQQVRLPEAAFRGESFELDASESFPVSAVHFDDYWALQFDKFDPEVPGRIWRTEATVASTSDAAFGGARLTLLDSQAGIDYVRSVPSIVGRWIRSPGLRDYGVQLSGRCAPIRNDSELQTLYDLVLDHRRTRPVVVFSETRHLDAWSEATRAAARFAGLAHVFFMHERMAREFAAQVGEEFSVRAGAIRTFSPGFSFADEVTAHPLATREWLFHRFQSIEQFIEGMFHSMLTLSVRNASLDQEFPTFRAVRQASLSFRLRHLAAPASNEREGILEKQNEELRGQIREKIDEYNYADSEVKAAQSERDQYRSQVMAMRTLVQRLELQLGSREAPVSFPSSLEGLDEWVSKEYPGRMVLLNRAARVAKKSPFTDPELVYRSLDRLAREYVDARRSGKPLDGLFDDLGVGLERTGDPNRLSHWKEKYFVPHRGANQFLEWHLKKGTDHNESNTLRIYFFYDEDDEQVIVGHLPSHLTNSRS
jgi:hypothetical protein